MYRIKLSCLLFLILVSYHVLSQNNWTISSIDIPKSFIENKGQFDLSKTLNEEVLYSSKIDGLEYFFYSTGYAICKTEWVKPKESLLTKVLRHEKEKEKEEEEKEENERKVNKKITYQKIEFKHSNPNHLITAENKLNHYYAYSILKDKEAIGVKANCYKKIVYNNIYDNIDLVFEIPKDSNGLKYSFILHPGADVSVIEIEYRGAKNLTIDQGNFKVETKIGEIVEFAPLSYYQTDKKKILSSFLLNGKVLKFKLDLPEVSNTVVIDPWTVTSLSLDSVYYFYDIDFDSNGNVYSYGEDIMEQLTLVKLDPNGNLMWIYSPILLNTYNYYGDFAIDKLTNRIFLTEGWNGFTGAQIIRIDENATQEKFFQGDINFAEMWRISYSNCSNQAVIAGGGTSNPTYQTCYLDFDIENMTMLQYVVTNDCCHDVNMLALDDYGYCYQITNRTSAGPDFDNHLVKLPLPNLLPIVYNVPTQYKLNEANSNFFYINGGLENGYNGIATFENNVYTYDSHNLKKWDSENGNLLFNKVIHSVSDSSELSNVFWGGLEIDACGRIFIGYKDSLLILNSNFLLINSYQLPDSIIDLKLDKNFVYICGADFITKIELESSNSCNPFLVEKISTNKDCNQKGSAKINISGGVPPYDIKWNTSPPQTTTEINNLEAGVYKFIVKDATCNKNKIQDSIIIYDFSNEKLELKNPTNIFSPDKDKSNDFYYPFNEFLTPEVNSKIENYHFIILNRWGNVIFETNNPSEGWNGLSSDNKSATEGVYYWKLSLKVSCLEDTKEYNGFFHLIR